MKRAVFLDRDGTINEMVYNPDFGLVDSPASPDQFLLIAGVVDAIRRINESGLLAIVVSNQPGIAKGKYTPDILAKVTSKMKMELAKSSAYVDGIYYCLHHPQSVLDEYKVSCDCRKPKPGLLLKAAQDLDIDLCHSYMIGDGITDIIAGKEAGCTTVLLNCKKCYLCEELERQNSRPDLITGSLIEAVEFVFQTEEK
jgi:D-glycero-D-manno-heptose 1,7-bisphosphate phosphatase